MENNDSNSKPQQTGGLKLMTVFIAVLALHVVVIGGFTVYHLMSGGSSDADLLADKTHKAVKVSPEGSVASDGTLPDANSDKNATASTAPADASSPTATPAPAPTPAPDQSAQMAQTAPADTTTPAPAPTVPAPVAVTPAPTPAPTDATPSGPVITPSPIATAPAASMVSAPTPAPAPAMTDDSQASGGMPYVVKAHDSLARIARQHGTSVAKLKSANGLSTDFLRIGQKLTIPGKKQDAFAANGDTSSAESAPLSAAPAAMADTGSDQATLTPVVSAGHHVYTVMKGDTLTKIARKFKTTANALMAANNISNARKLSIGQKLKIPSREARSVTNNVKRSGQPDAEAKSKTSAQLANFVR